jgi:CheY-like chemotaxis protein
VTLRQRDDFAEITVADNGEGISAQWLPYVFDRFQQEDSSTTRVHGGLGLGLSLVQHLVELHGGQVSAASPGKGQGATFTVTLPITKRSAEDLRPATSTTPAASARKAPLRDLRVLVVDDDPEALDLASMILRSEGAEVRAAGSAVRALEIVKTWEPEVLVSDLAMPGEDGFMLLRALRTGVGRGRQHLPAIAVTAFETPENRMRALETGFDLYLTKPVDPAQLSEAVAEVARRAA